MSAFSSTRTGDVMAFDRESVRSLDRDGRLHIAVSNISKEGVDPYYGREIPKFMALGLDPDKIYYLYRPFEELEKGAATFNNTPILSKHIPVTAEAPQQELVIGSTGTDAATSAPYLQNSAVIWVADDIEDIEAERKKEWSCGYYYRAEMTPGNFNGLHFDGIMRDIVANHVALVDEGRAGRDVVVGDQMPKGLTMLKSRRALMLNGALAAYFAPKMAMDAKIDFGKIIEGVTAGTIGKTKKALATKIVAAVTPKLAMDEAVDTDDVVKLIAAVQGVADVPAEDDEIEDADDDDGMGADADGDNMAQVMAFLKGKLSDEDMAEIGKMCSPGAQDALPEDGIKPAVKEGEDKPAMDAALVGRTVAAMRVAEREVAPHIGEVKIACDSAASIYRLALDHAKIDHKGITDTKALRTMVSMIPAGPADPVIALDHKTVKDDFDARFPNRSKLVIS